MSSRVAAGPSEIFTLSTTRRLKGLVDKHLLAYLADRNQRRPAKRVQTGRNAGPLIRATPCGWLKRKTRRRPRSKLGRSPRKQINVESPTNRRSEEAADLD